MNVRIFFAISILITGAVAVDAQGTLSWQYDTTSYVVSPTDTITVSATVFSSSDTPYLIKGGGESYTGSSQYFYGVTWLDFLGGETVPAHGTLHFNFIKLSPIGGYVQPGVYNSDSAFINFAGIDDVSAVVYPQNSFQITVAVPEPSTAPLAGVGLVLLFVVRLRKTGVGGIFSQRLP
jgi:hypothetical protein